MCDLYESIFREGLKDFKVSEGGKISGYCNSSKQVEKLLDRLKTLGFAYCVRSSHVKRPAPGAEKRRAKYFFQQLQGHVHISFFGPAFSVESSCTRHCVLGPKYYTKREIVVPDHLLDHVIPKKKRLRVPDTKKCDCPAVLYIKRVRVYPGYAIQSVSELWETKAKVLRKLRKDMELPQKPYSYLRFYLVASPASQHTHSTEIVLAKGGIHPLLAKEIQNLVQNGTTSVKVIKLALDQFVDNFFKGSHTPDRMNTTFYPPEKVIYTHVYRALNMMKKPVLDQGTLTNDIISIEISSDEETEVTNHILETSDSYLQQLEAREHNPETSNSYSQQLNGERVLQTSDSCSQQLEANECVLQTLNSYSQQLKANECVLQTFKRYSQLLQARKRVLETSNNYSQQLKARECVLQTSNSYSQQLKANECVLQTFNSYSKLLQARKRVLETSNNYSQKLKAGESVLKTSNSYSQQLKARKVVAKSSNSYSQQLKTREHIPKTSDNYLQLLEHVPETSNNYLQLLEHDPETSNSNSQQPKPREHLPEISNSYSQQLEARELCEQVSNLTYSCSNSEALQEVLGLLRDCVRKLHLANAEVGGQPVAGPSTSKQ